MRNLRRDPAFRIEMIEVREKAVQNALRVLNGEAQLNVVN
jgi:hypothetical protein